VPASTGTAVAHVTDPKEKVAEAADIFHAPRRRRPCA
jgi:hypothetical protein